MPCGVLRQVAFQKRTPLGCVYLMNGPMTKQFEWRGGCPMMASCWIFWWISWTQFDKLSGHSMGFPQKSSSITQQFSLILPVFELFSIGFATSNYDQIQNWTPGTWEVLVRLEPPSVITPTVKATWDFAFFLLILQSGLRLVDTQLMTCLIKGSVFSIHEMPMWIWFLMASNQKFSINFPKKKHWHSLNLPDFGYTALAA